MQPDSDATRVVRRMLSLRLSICPVTVTVTVLRRDGMGDASHPRGGHSATIGRRSFLLGLVLRRLSLPVAQRRWGGERAKLEA